MTTRKIGRLVAHPINYITIAEQIERVLGAGHADVGAAAVAGRVELV